MRHIKLVSLCAAGLFAFSVVAKADNIVVNPTFGPANPGFGYGAVAGWTQSPYPSTLAGYPYLTGSNSANGEFWDNGSVDASTVGFIQVYPGAENDSLSQTLTLTPGQQYSFSFYENARTCPTCVNPSLMVDLGGNTLVSSAIISPAGAGDFDFVSGTFIASSASEDLAFLVSGSGDATALITNVSVAATPEPASVLLFGTALAGLMIFYRRKFLRA